METQYSIEYDAHPHGRSSERRTDFCPDPVACELHLRRMLEDGVRIWTIRRDAIALPPREFDRLVRTAASNLAAERVCTSLGIKPEEERFRFGFSA